MSDDEITVRGEAYAPAAEPPPTPQEASLPAPDDALNWLLAGHSVLVGLTPLIPIPLLDDAVKGYIERRLVSELARKYGLYLDKQTIATLAGDPDESFLKTLALGVVTFPFKLIFRKLFVVLEVKRASDEASLTFHRGHLVARALRARIVQPLGPKSAKEVRAAIDGSLDASALSPMRAAILAVFEGSRDLLSHGVKSLLKALKPSKGGVSEADVSRSVDAAQADAGFFGTVTARVKKAVDELPSEHLAAIEASFDARLGVRL